MKLSTTAFYAVCAVTYLGRRAGKECVTSHQAAKDLMIPKGFLLRILVTLSRAGILWTLKGPHGGYKLARPPKDITLLEIIEAVDGPLQSTEFHSGGLGSPAVNKKLEAISKDLTESARRQLARITVADLLKKK
ncbi:MAG: hypothetical protein KatS3mg105_1977 [Gemmatales bacterium]|nr:MAG: hypothetical protein KatS3mg105_1977 [Gemmatales bacterium]